MKKLYALMVVALCMGMTACSSDEEIIPDTTPVTNTVCPTFYAPSFPKDDGSKALTGTQYANFKKLLEASTPEQALNRVVLQITDEQFAEIKAEADKICVDCADETAKIKALQKWVKNNVKYNYSDNNAYQVFRSKQGVCQGYANLLKAMLLSQGIPCVIVNGWYEGAGAHAWNYAYSAAAKKWYVCDPTNSTTPVSIVSTGSYSHLLPEMADIILFEDDNFAYNYYENSLNVCEVRCEVENIVVPFSVAGFRITMFNPNSYLPASARNIYIGKNITSLGNNIKGLVAYPAEDEKCFVDPENEWFGSANGVIYNKDWQGNLTSIVYIPSMMKTVTLLPMEKVEKNTIYYQNGVETIIFPKGTKSIEAYAIEACPNLTTVYVPEDCKVDPQAVYNCPLSVDIIKGEPTGIKQVRI